MSNKASSSYRSQEATAATLSLLEKLDAYVVVLTVVANIITAAFTGVFRSKARRPKSYYRYIALTAMRTMTRKASVRQQHYLAQPTDDAYVVACKRRKAEPRSEMLEDGTRAHWIGNPKAQKIIINFHGGGYVFPAAPAMFEFLWQVVDICKAEGKEVASLFLSYDLAPGATYPRQLQQASSLLNHVLRTLKIKPENIILTGDSAGANLALGLLSHISHPHPSAKVPIPKIEFEGEIRGAVLISPWVAFKTEYDSFRINEFKDLIGPKAVKQWSSAFLASPYPHKGSLDNYNQPVIAPEGWWEGLKIQEVLVVAGADETLLDGIREWEAKFERGLGGGKTKLVVVEGEFHDQNNLDPQMLVSREGEQSRLIKKWVASKL